MSRLYICRAALIAAIAVFLILGACDSGELQQEKPSDAPVPSSEVVEVPPTPSTKLVPESPNDETPSPEPSEDLIVSGVHSQLFYGEWVVEDTIEGGRFSYRGRSKEEMSEYIGAHISYDSYGVAIDGETVLKDPEYTCVLVASENYRYYFHDNVPADINDIIDTSTPYFAVVFMNALDASIDDITLLSRIVIKDDDTIVLYTDSIYFKLTRISHPEDYQSGIVGP